jgi:protocatechuate 3,4-dioxygenase beta subunit
MKRKHFVRLLGLIPVVSVPFRLQGRQPLQFFTDSCKTGRDAEGPFYKSGAPERNVIGTRGLPLRVEGRVLKAEDCSSPVSGAIIDIWHCDDEGNYDMEGYSCRGQVKTDTNGNYTFTTIYPPSYGGRARHIHFKIRAAGFSELTTQLYFQGDPKIQNDFARNAESDRVIGLRSENDIRVGRFDIYL